MPPLKFSMESYFTYYLLEHSPYLRPIISHIISHPYLGKIPILTNIFQMGSNHQLVLIYQFISGQIIATSHDLGPHKVAKQGKSPKISGKSRLVKYYNLPIFVHIYIYTVYLYIFTYM